MSTALSPSPASGQAGAGLGSIREYMARFMNVLGSPNRSGPGYICRAPRGLAGLVTYGAHTEPSWGRTDCAVMWAQSITNSYGWVVRDVIANKRRGTKLIVIDPVRTELADLAGLWIRPKYGSDCCLALAAANVIIEERLCDEEFVTGWCTGWDELVEHISHYTPLSAAEVTGVPAAQIREFARMYATAKSSYLADGNGFDQQVNSVQTAQGYLYLPGSVR